MNITNKPLGHKSYGSIPHLPNSRMGPGDHKCHEGQARIATERVRDKWDRVIVQEKLDGGACAAVRIGDEVLALGRAGYLAETSPFVQHHYFASWVKANADRFMAVITDGERLVGEWLVQAHSTRYDLYHEPFVVFDLMVGHTRATYAKLCERVWVADFVTPYTVHYGDALGIDRAMGALGKYGHHGAIDPIEGAVWRVERNKLVDRHSGKRRWIVDFLVKFVREDKIDGVYLPELSGADPVWNVPRQFLQSLSP